MTLSDMQAAGNLLMKICGDVEISRVSVWSDGAYMFEADCEDAYFVSLEHGLVAKARKDFWRFPNRREILYDRDAEIDRILARSGIPSQWGDCKYVLPDDDSSEEE